MLEIEIQVSGDACVIELEEDWFHPECNLHLYNNPFNPASTLFLQAPASKTELQWYSKLIADGPLLDLILLLQAPTHIYQGDYTDFNKVLITDEKILTQTATDVVLDSRKHFNIKIIIDNFRAREGYIFAQHVSLMQGGFIEKLLGIQLNSKASELDLIGGSKDNKLIIEKLDLRSSLKKLTLNQVKIIQSFHYGDLADTLIEELLVDNTETENLWTLNKINNIKTFSLTSKAIKSHISTDSILITNLLAPHGKFYINAHSYVNFHRDISGVLQGVDLILDFNDSHKKAREVFFSGYKFNFEVLKIINASSVKFVEGGSCRQLILENCTNFIACEINAGDVIHRFSSPTTRSLFSCSLNVVNNIIIAGAVDAVFNTITAKNIEAYGLCSVKFTGSTTVKMLKVNLNLDAANPLNNIPSATAAIRIAPAGETKVNIENILGKISTLYVKGNVKLGSVIVQPINKLPTLLWVDIKSGISLELDRMFVGFDHDINISADGTISVIKTSRMIDGGSGIYASVSNATASDYIHVRAGSGISFHGSIQVIKGDASLFTKYGDLFINGKLQASKNLVLHSQSGAVIAKHAVLEAKAIAIYSSTDNFIIDTIIRAEKLVIYTLQQYIKIVDSTLTANNVAVIAKVGSIEISSSQLHAEQLTLKSGADTTISSSKVIVGSLFAKAVGEFVLAKTGITLSQYPHQFFVSPTPTLSTAQGGIAIAKDLTLIAIFSNDELKTSLAKLQWQQVDFNDSTKLALGQAYIDARKGYLTGSTIDASDMVVIRIADSLEIVPLVLYNEILNLGGFNTKTITEVATRINAGTIDIAAGKSATYMGALLQAIEGKIKAPVNFVLASPEEIKQQQNRINTFKEWFKAPPPDLGKLNVGKYFNFSQSTHIIQKVGNLDIYDQYSSKDLAFTQEGGADIIVDKTICKYGKLYLNSTTGKILIISRDLQQIYENFGSGLTGKTAAMEERTIIGGKHIYLIGDAVKVKGGKFQVKGDLKIITKRGVELLPVSVHERLVYHHGSKTTIIEDNVRLVISEINAGYLDIQAGKAFEAISALIQATNINIKAEKLAIKSEQEIFEKQIHFQGKAKWYGGANASKDTYHDGLIIPTIINAKHLYVEINGDSTIEAAQILVEEESLIKTSGDLHLLPKYDIHLHDHYSEKTYLFHWNKRGLIVAGSKSVHEHFYGSKVIPTIYYSNGDFYGYSEGYIHLLGAKVIGRNIYLSGNKGIKLEAASFNRDHLISINESGIRVGYNSADGSHSISSEYFQHLSQDTYKNTLHEATEILAKNRLEIAADAADLEIISSKLNFQIAKIKVRGLNIHAHQNSFKHTATVKNFSIGVHIGIQESISSTASKLGKLLNKSGHHWLDILDRGLNLYDLYGDISNIANDIELLAKGGMADNLPNKLKALSTTKFGAWANLRAEISESEILTKQAVDSEITGDTISIAASGHTHIEGIKCNVGTFELNTESLEIKASSDSSVTTSYSSAIDLNVPIAGAVGTNVSLQNSLVKMLTKSFHEDNCIKVKGKLSINVEKDGRISGVQLHAKEVYLKARNLILESVQNVVQQRLENLSINIGLNIVDALTGFSLGTMKAATTRDVAWTQAIGSIIGTELVNISVQQTLEIVGGLIANSNIDATGKLTDQGNLQVKAATLIAKKLHDYDDGKTLGLGINLGRQLQEDGVSWKNKVGMPVKYGFNEKYRDILPTISQGSIELAAEELIRTKKINRIVGQHVGSTSVDKAAIDASIPISDIYEYLSTLPVTGVAAGEPAEPEEDPEEQARQAAKAKYEAQLAVKLAKYIEQHPEVKENADIEFYLNFSDLVINHGKEQGLSFKQINEATPLAYSLLKNKTAATAQEQYLAIEVATQYINKQTITAELASLAGMEFKSELLTPLPAKTPKVAVALEPTMAATEIIGAYLGQWIDDHPKEVKALETFKPKSIKEAQESFKEDIKRDPSLSKKLNISRYLAAIGESYEVVSSHVVYVIAQDPVGRHILSVMGHVVGGAFRSLEAGLDTGAKAMLSAEEYRNLCQTITEQPHGIKVLMQETSGIIFTAGVGGVASKLAGVGKVTGEAGAVAEKVSSILTQKAQSASKLFKDTATELTLKGKAGKVGRQDMKKFKELGMEDVKRNFDTVYKWEGLASHIEHLDAKLPKVADMKTTYPKQDATFGIRKEWNKGHNEIVIKRARPDSIYAEQQVDYVSIKAGGQMLAKDGSFIIEKPDGLYRALPKKANPLAPDPKASVKLAPIPKVVKPNQHPDVHIPLSVWKKWQKWHKP